MIDDMMMRGLPATDLITKISPFDIKIYSNQNCHYLIVLIKVFFSYYFFTQFFLNKMHKKEFSKKILFVVSSVSQSANISRSIHVQSIALCLTWFRNAWVFLSVSTLIYQNLFRFITNKPIVIIIVS